MEIQLLGSILVTGLDVTYTAKDAGFNALMGDQMSDLARTLRGLVSGAYDFSLTADDAEHLRVIIKAKAHEVQK